MSSQHVQIAPAVFVAAIPNRRQRHPRTELVIHEEDALSAYLQQVARMPRLSASEEVALFAQVQAGDTAARARFIEANLRLVVAIAREYATKERQVPLIDLIQYGNIGLIQALEAFDPARGRFSTYAYWWIHQAIRRGLAEESPLSLPVYQQENLARIKSVHYQLERTLERQPTPEEVAAQVALPVSTITRVLRASTLAMSLEAPLEDTEEATLGATIADTLDVAEEATQTVLAQQIEDVCRDLLPARELDILRYRYGLWGAPRLKLITIAHKLGVSRERVRQLEKRAFKRLRSSGFLRQLLHELV